MQTIDAIVYHLPDGIGKRLKGSDLVRRYKLMGIIYEMAGL